MTRFKNLKHLTNVALLTFATVAPLASGVVPVRAETLAIGIDRKFAYDEKAIRQALEPGRDEVMFFDLADPEHPRLNGVVSLENSILGPPTNIAITPDQSLALIANSMHSEKTPSGWKAVPADELFVVDLKASPPKLVQTLKVGRQPSGVAISKDGRIALVANRASSSISVLTIANGKVSLADTLDTGESVGAVAISPDGRRALATKTVAHKVVLFAIGEAGKLTFERDLWVGLFPWNIAISPDGTMALVNNIGNAGQSDGSAKTVSVIDLTAEAPYVREHISVGDAPEGVAFNPQGTSAILSILQGSYDAPPNAWFRHDAGEATLLAIGKGKVSVVNSVAVGAFPEGVAFAADGRHAYVGNFHSNTLSILKVDDTGHLVKVGDPLKLPGPPASLRIGSR